MPAQRLPFNFIDEIFVHSQSVHEPLTIQVDVRLGGSVDVDRLRDAIAAALARHPRARARLAPWTAHGSGFEWIIDATATEGAVEVRDGTERELDALRAEFYGRAIPFDRSPQVRVLLVRAPGGDRVLVSTHHACSDGVGALRFLRSIARAYDGRHDPVPRSIPVTLEPAARGLWQHMFAWPGMHTDVGWNALRLTPPSRITPDGGDHRAGYGVLTVKRPSADLTHAALRRTGATVNDLLLAGLHLVIEGWNADHHTASGHLAVHMPINARPAAWREEILGNFLLMERVSTAPWHRRTPAAAVRAVGAQTRRAKQRLPFVRIPTVSGALHGIPIAVRMALGKALPFVIDHFVDSAVLSNLGRADPGDLSFGPDLPATDLYFSPPARMPIGLSIGACGFGDDLFLSFRYCHAQFGPEAAGAFAALYLAQLDALGSSGSDAA